MQIFERRSYHGAILAIIATLTVIFGSRLGKLQFDYDFEAFFPNEDHELELYQEFRTKFEYDNEFVLLGLENRRGIFRQDFLLKADSLCGRLQTLEHVRQVISPTNIRVTRLSGPIPYKVPLLHMDDEGRLIEDSAAIYRSGKYLGSFFPKRGGSICIYIKTSEGLSKEKSDRLAEQIETVLSDFNFDNTHVAGRIFAQRVYVSSIRREFGMFVAIAFVLVVIFLWLSFRSLYGILVPVAVVLVSIVWTLGTMQLIGKPIDIMTIMLPTMIFVTGMSDVVHFFSKYLDELKAGKSQKTAFLLIVREVGFPTFLTLITTVVGFLSLLFSSIRPIRDFGIYTSIGVGIAFTLTYTLLPALLYFFPTKAIKAPKAASDRVHSALHFIMFWIFRHQKAILAVAALVLIVAIAGIRKIKTNHILLEDLSEKVQIKRDFNFFDSSYSGLRPLELRITFKNGHDAWDHGSLLKLDSLGAFIKAEFGTGFLSSPASVVREFSEHENAPGAGDFPDEEQCAEIVALLKKNKNNKELRRLASPDGKTARLSAKIRDLGSAEVNVHNEALFEWISKHTDPSAMQIELTGAAHLMDLNNDYMVKNMIQGFVFSIGLISFLTFLLHRSWRMTLVFIIPNLIPLLIIGGIMGFAGIELKAATSLVFSIAFGIATDDTIHFISRLKIELAYGKSLLYAFKRTYLETGRPIALTTFILTGGFMSLMLSDFQSTFYFGFLICITIIVALLADMFLLPILLFLIYRPGKR